MRKDTQPAVHESFDDVMLQARIEGRKSLDSLVGMRFQLKVKTPAKKESGHES